MGLWETIDTSAMVIYYGSASDERGIDLATMRMKGLWARQQMSEPVLRVGQLVEREARGANTKNNSI